MRGILERQMRKCGGLVCCPGQGGVGDRVEGTLHTCDAGIGKMRECASAVLGASTPPRPDMLSLSLSHHAGRAQTRSKISLPSPAPRPRHWPLRSLHVYWWARSPHKDQSFRPRDPERGALGWAASIAGITFSKVLSIVTLYIQYSTALPFRICV